MSLIQREKRFANICDRFNAIRPGKLAAFYEIPKIYFEAIKIASLQYLSSSVQKNTQSTKKN